MIDKLDLHNGFIGRRLQHPVVVPAARMVVIDRATQRTGPKSGRFIDVRGVAIDQHGAQARMVHVGPSTVRSIHGRRNEQRASFSVPDIVL